MVSLSEGVSAALADLQADGAQQLTQPTPTDACIRLSNFCSRVKRALSPILPAPTCRAQPQPKRARQRRQPVLTTPRRSVRLAKGAWHGSAVTKQQQVIIRKLCLAHEGDTIGDEALQAYIRLFDNPLNDA